MVVDVEPVVGVVVSSPDVEGVVGDGDVECVVGPEGFEVLLDLRLIFTDGFGEWAEPLGSSVVVVWS